MGIILARNRVALLIITDAGNMISTEANNAVRAVVTYLPFWWLWVRIVLGAFCRRLQSRRYIAGRTAAAAITCVDVRVSSPSASGIEDSRPVLLRCWRSGSSSKGNTNMVITETTILSLG